MMTTDRSKPDFWSGRTGFILANMSAAIGLGSIWKFPYEVGANGGSAFILFYLAGLVAIVFPLMLAELAIGRRGRADAIESIAAVALEAGASRSWRLIGALGAVAAVLILSFYSVIGGWAIAYVADTALHGLRPVETGAAAQRHFDALMASPGKVAAYHAIFMLMTALIVARGVAGGIESASKILMPALIVLLLALAVYAGAVGDLARTLRFLLTVDTAHLTPRVALDALGLGFFSIGVGLSTMITYAAYAGRGIDFQRVAVATIVGDTAISFVAGLAIFPLVFAEGLDPAGGPGLMFVTLPIAFARLPFGVIVAVVFFLLVVIAAIGSAISLLELAVAIVRRALGWSRRRATLACAAACWILGLSTVLSFSWWAAWHPLGFVPAFARASVFDLIDHLTSNLLLPFGGFALALFAGWALPQRFLADEIGVRPLAGAVLRFLLRYVAPGAIALVTLAPVLT